MMTASFSSSFIIMFFLVVTKIVKADCRRQESQKLDTIGVDTATILQLTLLKPRNLTLNHMQHARTLQVPLNRALMGLNSGYVGYTRG